MINKANANYELLILAGSAGSLKVVMEIIAGLKQLSLPVIVLLHRQKNNNDLLAGILADKTMFMVKEAEDKETLEAGTIYVAPADYHLLVEKDHSVSLDLTEKINFSRPGIDVCFETAAEAYHDKLVAVLLSGGNADGSKGLLKIKSLGGTTIVQNPLTAQVPDMPREAISLTQPEYIVAGSALSIFINDLLDAQ